MRKAIVGFLLLGGAVAAFGAAFNEDGPIGAAPAPRPRALERPMPPEAAPASTRKEPSVQKAPPAQTAPPPAPGRRRRTLGEPGGSTAGRQKS